MLETHYIKSMEGIIPTEPRPDALQYLQGGLLKDYLDEPASTVRRKVTT